MTHGAGLAGLAAALNVHHDVEGLDILGDLQGLHHDHAAGFTLEEIRQLAAIDGDLASAALEENTGHGALAAAGAIVVVTDHFRPP